MSCGFESRALRLFIMGSARFRRPFFMRHLFVREGTAILSAKKRLEVGILPTVQLRFSLGLTRETRCLLPGLERKFELTVNRLKLEKKMAVQETGVTLVRDSGRLRIIRACPEMRITQA